MQESTARKRKAGFQTQDNGIVDDGKQVRTSRFLSGG
jgi:hypothetical protein